MTQAERDAFLAEPRVAILAVADPPRGPLAVPVWYDRLPSGELWVFTPKESRKARLIARAGRMTLSVQEERPPYRYVTVEGPVASEPATFEQLRHLARRYYGETEGDAYAETHRAGIAAGTRIVLRLTPERWLSVDYGKR